MMRKIAVLFSGGGSQYPGMMKDLYDRVPASREIFDKADAATGRKLSDVCFWGTEEALSETSTMIPAIFTADMAAFAALNALGIRPAFAAGFSLGEWAAITAAGMVPFETAIRLVQLRSDAMEAATPHEGAGMAVVMGKPNDYVEALCARVTAGYVCPANYNYPGQIAVSGTNAALAELERIAQEDETTYQRLAVNVPSHCALMQPAMERLRAALENVSFTRPKFSIVSNATAEPSLEPEEIKENIVVQLVQPVRFEQSIHRMIADGADTFIELGPGKTLSKFVKKIAKTVGADVSVMRVASMETLDETLNSLQ